MSSKLNIQDIVDFLVAKGSITKEEAALFIDKFFFVIEQGLSVDGQVKVKDFGTFKLTEIQERKSVDVNTKEDIIIPAHRRVNFTPASNLKDLVNKPFAHFETTLLNDDVLIEGIEQEDDTFDENTENTFEDDASTDDISNTTEEETLKDENPIVIATEAAKKESDDILSLNNKPSIAPNEVGIEESSLNISNEEREEHTPLTPIKGGAVLEKTIPSKSNKKHYLITPVFIGFVLLCVGAFSYNYFFANKTSKKKAEKVANLSNNLRVEAPAPNDSIISSNKTTIPVDSVKSEKPLVREKVKLTAGKTLRLIALDKLGSKEFWIYIYMVNKEKITNPNLVPAGLVLELPFADEYPMDANNATDVAKAKELSDALLGVDIP